MSALRNGLEALMSELDRNGEPRRMVSIRNLRELLAAHNPGDEVEPPC